MAICKGEHDQVWKKFFVAVTPVKRQSTVRFKILGVGTVEDCIDEIEEWYEAHKTYNSSVKLGCFTGGMAEIKVTRTATGVTLDKPKIIHPFIQMPPKRIPPNGIGSANPTRIDWHNNYCVLDVVKTKSGEYAKVLVKGSISDCKQYMSYHIYSQWLEGKDFVLVSLDGHVYHVSPGIQGERICPSVYVKSWPLPHLWC